MIDKFLRGHVELRRSFLAGEREFLRRLASEGQSPDTMYVGCSDSRVVPEILTASSPGEIFVVRNVANVVPPFEHAATSVGAAVEYAVTYLHVANVIVCGHYGCGGVRALIDGADLRGCPSLREWLEGARPAIERTDSALDPEARWRAAVEQNVLLQLGHLPTYPAVAEALGRGALALHGWVYDLYSLELRVYDVTSEAFLPVGDVLRG